MDYNKFKKGKKDKALSLADTTFMDLTFMESLIITASLDGLLDLNTGITCLV